MIDSSPDSFKRKHGHNHHRKKPKYKCKSPLDQDKPHCRFKTRPRYFNRTSPSRTNGPLTPLGYAQFYLPDIDTATADSPPEWQIEYSTFKWANLLPRDNGTDEGRDGQKVPVPVKFLPGYDGEVMAGLIAVRDQAERERQGDADTVPNRREAMTDEAYEDDLELLELDDLEDEAWEAEEVDWEDDGDDDTVDDRVRRFKKGLQKITPWKMRDLTIPQYVKLARKLVAEKKMWKQFSNLM